MAEAAVTSDAPQFSQLIVEFYMDAVLDEKASYGWTEERYNPETGELRPFRHLGAGREIYTDVEHIEIRIPGNIREVRRRPVRPTDKQHFAREYAAFQQTRQNPVFGTPLDKLPFLKLSQIKELQAIGLRTAENVRDISDGDAQKFMGIQAIKQQIKDFLAAAEGHAPLQAMRGELQSRDAEIAALKAQMAEIVKQGEKKK